MLKQYIKNYGVKKGLTIIVAKILHRFYSPIAVLLIKTRAVKNNRILFNSVPDYGDNARSLFEHMISNKLNNRYQIIWLVLPKNYNEIKTKLSDIDNVVVVKYTGKWSMLSTPRALYFTMTSKYVFFTHGSPVLTNIQKDGQLVVNLWHGCGFKEKEKTTVNKNYKPYTDFYIVPGELFVETKSKYWNCAPEKVLPIGYPRYDLLFNENIRAKDYIDSFKKDYKTKIVIWMPTFRNSGIAGRYPESQLKNSLNLPIVDTVKKLSILDKICEDVNVKILIKKHPMQSMYKNIANDFKNILFIEDKEFLEKDLQLYEILPYTDALITDYSSVAFDYLLLDKPISFILDDFEDYQTVRGFIFKDPLKYMPGHHVYSSKEFKQFILDISLSKDKFKKQRYEVSKYAHNSSDNYSENIIKAFNL